MLKRILQNKWAIILLGLAGLLALNLVASSLENLRFEPAHAIAFDMGGETQVVQPVGSRTEVTMMEALLVGAVILVLVSVIYVLLDAESRKKFLRYFSQLVFLAILAFVLVNQNIDTGDAELQNMEPAGASASVPNIPMEDPPVFTEPEIPAWVQFLLSFGMAVGVVGVFGWMAYRFKKNQSAGTFTLDEIAHIAQKTIQELEDGDRWDDAIIQCYLRMSDVVGRERGFTRQAAMTPTEFASMLERVGLPGEAIRTLTGLFEEVRYGARQPSREKTDLAMASLNAILRACGVQP